jgi:hypothetical protein
MLSKFTLPAAGVMALLSANAYSADSWLTDMFQIRGYGTLGVTHSSLDQGDFVASQIEPQGAGYTKSWSPDVDSKLAVQLNAKFTSRLTAVVQLISESATNSSWTGSTNPRYRPSLEWASLKYQITDGLSVRAGRLVLPLNMISETRNVGFANHFVRGPVETYGAIPFTNYDGGELTYRRHFGDNINTFAIFGGGEAYRSDPFKAEVHLAGFNDTFESGALTLHLGFLHSPFKLAYQAGVPDTLFLDFVQAANGLPGGSGTTAAAAAANVGSHLDPYHWSSMNHYDAGAIYDPGKWFAMAEFYAVRNAGLFGDEKTGWVSGGYRYRKFTPYATYARVKSSYITPEMIPVAGLPPALAGYGALLNGYAAAVTDRNVSQQTLSAGVRWDFMTNLDAKLQYDHVKLDDGSIGRFANAQPDFPKGGNANVVSITIDFAF